MALGNYALFCLVSYMIFQSAKHLLRGSTVASMVRNDSGSDEGDGSNKDGSGDDGGDDGDDE